MSEIVLHPDRCHCIQTVAKHEYERILKELLNEVEVNVVLEERFQMLKAFLESADFAELRRSYEPYLVEGKSVVFTLRSMEGSIAYEFQVE